MNRIAKFEKVSYEQFEKDYLNTVKDEELTNKQIRKIYDNIKLPIRATSGSAGYDFYMPFQKTLKPNESVKIPTGIRVKIEEGWVLQLFPRSGLGTKYRLQLDNTVGIVDNDYYGSDNEGHIFAKITNDSKEITYDKTVTLNEGQAFMQGVFVQYGITEDDDSVDVRNGGFGSTDKENTEVDQNTNLESDLETAEDLLTELLRCFATEEKEINIQSIRNYILNGLCSEKYELEDLLNENTVSY